MLLAAAFPTLVQPPALQHVQSRLPASRAAVHATATVQPPAGKQQQQKKGGKKKEEGPYSSSVSLPITDFSQRAEAVTREPELQQFWREQRTYEKLVEVRASPHLCWVLWA
jgi:hypothetical protein